MTMRDNSGRRVGTPNDGWGWGIPALVAAILIIGGLFYMFSDGTRTTTASNDRPAVTQSGPAGSQAPVLAPTTTPAPAPAPAPSR